MPAIGLRGSSSAGFRVVGADHQHGVGIREIFADFIHLQHHIVWHLRLRQQHVHVARQAPRDRVNTETDLHAARSFSVISATGYCACARRHAVTRVMITEVEFFNCSATSSAVVSRYSPHLFGVAGG